jgi:hypothetical protein
VSLVVLRLEVLVWQLGPEPEPQVLLPVWSPEQPV